MRLLGVDVETTGKDPETCRITELGLMSSPIEPGSCYFSSLVWEPGYPKLDAEVREVTGLTDEVLEADGERPKVVLEQLAYEMGRADYLVAHNKRFDRTVIEREAKHYGVDLPKKPWLCTYTEVPYPPRFGCKKLAHLALDHGIPMDGRQLHRAVQDVALMLEVLGKYPLEDVLAYATTPWVYLRIVIPPPWEDNGAGNTEAKKLGYGYEKARGTDKPSFPKKWVKRVKKDQAAAAVAETRYQVVVLTEEVTVL